MSTNIGFDDAKTDPTKPDENLERVTADRQYQLTKDNIEQELRFQSYARAINRIQASGIKEAPSMAAILAEAEVVYQWVKNGTVPSDTPTVDLLRRLN